MNQAIERITEQTETECGCIVTHILKDGSCDTFLSYAYVDKLLPASDVIESVKAWVDEVVKQAVQPDVEAADFPDLTNEDAVTFILEYYLRCWNKEQPTDETYTEIEALTADISSIVESNYWLALVNETVTEEFPFGSIYYTSVTHEEFCGHVAEIEKAEADGESIKTRDTTADSKQAA